MVVIESQAEVTFHLESGNTVLVFVGDDDTTRSAHDRAQNMRENGAIQPFEVPLRLANPAWLVSPRLPDVWLQPQPGEWVTLRPGNAPPIRLQEVSRGPTAKLLNQKGRPDPLRIMAAFTGNVP